VAVPNLGFVAETLAAIGVLLPAGLVDSTSPYPTSPAPSAAHRRLWATPGNRLDAIVTSDFGKSFAGKADFPLPWDQQQINVAWGIVDAPERLPFRNVGKARGPRGNQDVWAQDAVPIPTAARLLPKAARATFMGAARRMISGDDLPGPILSVWLRLRLRAFRAGQEPAVFAREGLAHAYAIDGQDRGDKARQRCGNWTQETRLRDQEGREHRVVREFRCGSQRCPRCAARVAARWQPRVAQQVQRDLEAGRDHYFMVTLTLNPRDFLNAAEATKAAVRGGAGLWRRWIERLRRRYPDLAYLRVLEWHRNGYPHVHVLVRSQRLTEEALAAAKCSTMSELRDRVQQVETENQRRKKAGVRGRLHLPFLKVRSALRKMAIDSGFGKVFYLGPVMKPYAIAAEMIKTTQIHPSMVRDVRRFQPSGQKGDGQVRSFFHDEVEAVWPAKVPVPRLDQTLRLGAGEVGDVTVEPSPGLPQIRAGQDVHPGPGLIKVRVESAVVGTCRAGPRFELGLRVLEPAPFAHLLLKATVPFAHEDTIRDLLWHQGSVVRHPDAPVPDPTVLFGTEGWVDYAPRGSVDDRGRQRRFPGFRWVSGPPGGALGPGDGAAPVLTNLLPLTAFQTNVAPTTPTETSRVGHALFRAPPEEVAAALAASDRPDLRLCGAKSRVVADSLGHLYRRLVEAQEALVGREDWRVVLADCRDLLLALKSTGPDQFRKDPSLDRVIRQIDDALASSRASTGS